MKRRWAPGPWTGVGLATALFLLYAFTLTPGVPPTDSGELILAAWLPGVAHAPGFPFYVILGWLWGRLLPVGRVAWRLNLLSAACGALAVGLTYALALRTLRPAASGSASVMQSRNLSALAAASVGVLALGLGRTVWSWATAAEVYTVNLALTSAILLLLVRWTGVGEPRAEDSTDRSAPARPATSAPRPGRQGRLAPERSRRACPFTAFRASSELHPFDKLRASSERSRRTVEGPSGGSAGASAKRRATKCKPTSEGSARACPGRVLERPFTSQPDDASSGLSGRPGIPLLGQLSGLSRQPGDWLLVAAAFLFGLGLGNHLTSMALLAPAIVFWLTARCGWRIWWSKMTPAAALALLAGVTVYLYLPLRAAADPLLNWGNPDTWQRFWWHVTAKQYRVSLFSSPVGPQVWLAARLWWTQFTPLGLGLLAVGAWRMARRQRALFWTLTLVIACTTLYAWAYVIEDDQDAYYLPAFLAGAVWVVWGAEAVLSAAADENLDHEAAKGHEEREARRTRRAVRDSSRFATFVALRAFVIQAPFWPASTIFRAGITLAICLAVPALGLGLNWRACDRDADTIPEDYARDTFAEIAPGGVLLTRDWQLYSPALYLQQVEGLRPDLTIIDAELLRRGWYFDLLHRVDPGLMIAVGQEEQAFLVLRDAWERGEIPDGDPRIGQLQAAYVALLDAFIRQAAAAGRPVHIGPNRGAGPFRAATLAGQPDIEPGAGLGWRWIPVGLTFRATSLSVAAEPLSPLQWRVAAFQWVIPNEPERKIQATRADMAALRGLYHADIGDLRAAEADWNLALAVDPAHGPAGELLGRLKERAK